MVELIDSDTDHFFGTIARYQASCDTINELLCDNQSTIALYPSSHHQPDALRTKLAAEGGVRGRLRATIHLCDELSR